MITHEANVVYLMIWSVALANIFGAGTCLLLASQIAKLTTIRYTLIAPFMFGLIFFAAFQATREWGDLLMLMLLGTLGVYMKRFGWPRPALLIGYVLSTRVETSIYHTITTYGISFLTHPIVIILIILTVISVIAAIRYKPAQSEITEGGVHTARNKIPQCIFYGFILVLSLIVVWDGTRWDVLTGVYPLFAGGISLFFIIPLGIEMYRTKGASLVFYDSEKEEIDRALEYRSNEYYLMWLMGMLGVSALVGFVLGIGMFIYVFIRLKAKLSHLGCAISAGIFIMLLGALSHFMTLQYPEGILQSYVILPWPLQ
jgi:hypothetical protein